MENGNSDSEDSQLSKVSLPLGITSLRVRMEDIREFLNWNPKNVDKLRMEPTLNPLESEYDQLLWLWKCVELNLDQPLMIRPYMLSVKKGGKPHPVLPPLESYENELMQTEEMRERFKTISEDMEIVDEEIQEKNVEIEETKSLLENLESTLETQTQLPKESFTKVKKLHVGWVEYDKE